MDNTLVNFDTLLCSVLINNFLQPLPALIAWISDKYQYTKLTDNVEEGGGKKRKKRETRLVNNPQVNPHWKLCPGEKWSDVFSSSCLECQPDYNRQKVCNRWQIRGNCYADCRNANTHIAKDKFCAEIFSAFDSYVKK